MVVTARRNFLISILTFLFLPYITNETLLCFKESQLDLS